MYILHILTFKDYCCLSVCSSIPFSLSLSLSLSLSIPASCTVHTGDRCTVKGVKKIHISLSVRLGTDTTTSIYRHGQPGIYSHLLGPDGVHIPPLSHVDSGSCPKNPATGRSSDAIHHHATPGHAHAHTGCLGLDSVYASV